MPVIKAFFAIAAESIYKPQTSDKKITPLHMLAQMVPNLLALYASLFVAQTLISDQTEILLLVCGLHRHCYICAVGCDCQWRNNVPRAKHAVRRLQLECSR